MATTLDNLIGKLSYNENISKRARDILNKIDLFCRQQGHSRIPLSQIQTFKYIVSIELACKSLGISFDRGLAFELGLEGSSTRLQSKSFIATYLEVLRLIQPILNYSRSRLDIRELATKAGFFHFSSWLHEFIEETLEPLFESTYIKSLSPVTRDAIGWPDHPKFRSVFFYLVCQELKLRFNKSRALELANVRSSEFENLLKTVPKYITNIKSLIKESEPRKEESKLIPSGKRLKMSETRKEESVTPTETHKQSTQNDKEGVVAREKSREISEKYTNGIHRMILCTIYNDNLKYRKYAEWKDTLLKQLS